MVRLTDSKEWKPIDASFNKELENSVIESSTRKELETLINKADEYMNSYKDEILADMNKEITQNDIEGFSVKSLDLLSMIYTKIHFDIDWNITFKNAELAPFIDFISNQCVYKASDYTLMFGETVITYFFYPLELFKTDENNKEGMTEFNKGTKEIEFQLKWEVMRSLYELFNKWEIVGFGSYDNVKGIVNLDDEKSKRMKLIVYTMCPLNRKFNAINKNYMFYVDKLKHMDEMRKNLIAASGPNRETADMLMDSRTPIPELVN